MPFLQAAPVLSNQYLDDRVLRSYLRRVLPRNVLGAIEPDLTDLGEYAASAWTLARTRERCEPKLTQWDVWGERVDRIELTPAWTAAQPLAARHGLVAAGHEPTHGTHARVHQFSLVYLFHCASEFYTCPLAMSDGAATALKASGNQRLIERALPHLLSRDPEQFWIAGQWMTENAGGSDVAGTETVAREENGRWRLYGRKWFTSAINAQAALALARPAGAPAGSDALALFYLEPRKPDGRWRNIVIDRLKDKLGTRELPTAEIHLNGTPAELVGDRTYLLSRFLRGQAGSEWAIGAPLAAGAPFVLLDGNLVAIASGLGALERTLQLRVVAANRDHGDPTALALSVTPQATALMPPAPVHVTARRDGSGVTFTWIRRTRIDGDSWVGEVPLGEDSEQYALDILSGGSVVRTLNTAAPSAFYAAADELADFGTPQGALHIRVAQFSATVGRGFAADLTLTV